MKNNEEQISNKKFIFTVPEVHYATRTVIARSQVEAEELLKSNLYIEGQTVKHSELLPVLDFILQPTEFELEQWKQIIIKSQQ